MASQNTEMTLQQVQQFLAQKRANLVRKSAAAHVYTAPATNETITLLPLGKDKVRVQVMSGCVC